MKRLSVELHGPSLEALSSVRTAMDAASDAEAIRRSLQIVDQLVNHMSEGDRLVINRKDGTHVHVLLGMRS